MQQQIAAAFGHRKSPATVTVVAVCSTLRDDALHFEGKHWRDVTADDWLQYSDAFSGLSAEAFVYFLPSILTLSLDRANCPMGAADALIMSLDTSADPEIWPEWFSERFDLLSASEIEVIKDSANVYLADAAKGEGSEFTRVLDTLSMLELTKQG